MDAEEQYCPRCGSLNAHYGYQKSPAKMGATAVVEDGGGLPGVPATRDEGGVPVGQAVNTVNRVRRLKRAEPRGYGGAEVYAAVPQQYMPEMSGLMDLQRYPIDSADVELPTAWRDGVVRMPHPRSVGEDNGQQMYEVRGEESRGALPNPDTARALEAFGFVGFLGLGHMYGGRSTRGTLLMVLWWIGLALWVAPVLLHITLLGVMWALVLTSAVTSLSGRWIKNDLQGDTTRNS
jgi:hypothetical protein